MISYQKLLKINFEYRVLISYLIFGLALLTLMLPKEYSYNLIADSLGLDRQLTLTITFLIIGIVNLAAWLFRSYAGGFLRGHTAVHKKVLTDILVTSGPYRYVRNPLYLSDILSMTSIGFAGPPIAVLILFFGKIITSLLYVQYEEQELLKRWGAQYEDYLRHVPRFIPKLSPYLKNDAHEIKINWKDGLAYNFYAFGIGIAFIIAAFTQERVYLLAVGCITPLLWFFLRFLDRHIVKIVR